MAGEGDLAAEPLYQSGESWRRSRHERRSREKYRGISNASSPLLFFLYRGSAAKTLITHTKKTLITQYRQLRRLRFQPWIWSLVENCLPLQGNPLFCLCLCSTQIWRHLWIFSKNWFCGALSEYFFFYFGHKYVSKSYGHFRPHGCSMSLEVIFSIELERVFL